MACPSAPEGQLSWDERLADTKYVETLFDPVNVVVFVITLVVVGVVKLLHGAPFLYAQAQRRRARKLEQAERRAARAVAHKERLKKRAAAAPGDDGAQQEMTPLVIEATAPAFPYPSTGEEGGASAPGGAGGAGEAEGKPTAGGTGASAVPVAPGPTGAVAVKEKKSLGQRFESLAEHAHEATSYSGASAEHVSLTGMIVGTCIVLTGPRTPWLPGGDLLQETIDLLMWSALGMVFLLFARLVNDRVLLHNISNAEEIAKNNMAVGIVEAGAFVGSSLVIRSALSGDSGGDMETDLLATAIWFLVGQFVLNVSVAGVALLTKYNDHEEIKSGNAAAGIKFASNLVAMGIIIAHPVRVSGSVLAFVLFVALGALLQTVVRFFLDKLIVPGNSVDEEIAKDRNWGAATIEFAITTALALQWSGFMTLPDNGCSFHKLASNT